MTSVTTGKLTDVITSVMSVFRKGGVDEGQVGTRDVWTTPD